MRQYRFIVRDKYDHHYRLVLPYEDPVPGTLAPMEFWDLEYTRNFVLDLRVSPEDWLHLLHGVAPPPRHLTPWETATTVARLILHFKAIRVYALPHLCPWEGKLRFPILETAEGIHFHVIPASVLLIDTPPGEVKSFRHDADGAERLLQTLNLTDDQVAEITAALPSGWVAFSRGNPQSQRWHLHEALVRGEIVLVMGRPSAAGASETAHDKPAEEPAAIKKATLGPHAGVTTVNNKPVSPNPNPKLQAENDIKNGNVHKFDKDTKQVYDDYHRNPPKIGGTAKELAPKLAKMNEKEFTEFMDNEVKAGRCTVTAEHGVMSPLNAGQNMKSTQAMLKYEYPDGTMVRYKPEGDKFRSGQPTYSVEVKKNPLKMDPGGPNSVHSDVAYKVDEKANLLPKHQDYINNPYPDGSTEADVYQQHIMALGHKPIPN